jgi:hypothetical protein
MMFVCWRLTCHLVHEGELVASQRLTFNGHQLTIVDEQRMSNNEEWSTINGERLTTTNERLTINDEQLMIDI